MKVRMTYDILSEKIRKDMETTREQLVRVMDEAQNFLDTIKESEDIDRFPEELKEATEQKMEKLEYIIEQIDELQYEIEQSIDSWNDAHILEVLYALRHIREEGEDVALIVTRDGSEWKVSLNEHSFDGNSLDGIGNHVNMIWGWKKTPEYGRYISVHDIESVRWVIA